MGPHNATASASDTRSRHSRVLYATGQDYSKPTGFTLGSSVGFVGMSSSIPG